MNHSEEQFESIKSEIDSLRKLIEEKQIERLNLYKKEMSKRTAISILSFILTISIVWLGYNYLDNGPKYEVNSSIPKISKDDLLHANTSYQEYYINKLIYANKGDSAISVAHTILDYEPKNVEVLDMLAKAFQFNNQLDSASFYYQESQKIRNGVYTPK